MNILSEKDISKIKEENITCYFYGLGNIAEYSLIGAKSQNLNIQAIFDTHYIKDSNKEEFHGIKQYGQLNLMNISKDSYILISCSHYISVTEHLKKFGFKNIFDTSILLKFAIDKNLLGNIDNIRAERQYFAIKEKSKHANKNFTNQLIIPSIDVIVTERCTLKCADCANLMPYFEKPIDVNKEILLESLKRISSLSDEILELRILGGEPFLNKEINEILNFCINIKNSKKIIIYTNATIIPNQEIIYTLAKANKKIFVEITDYKNLSRRMDKLIEVFDKNKINYLRKELPESWDDSANIVDFGRNNLENQDIFNKCCAKYLFTLMHGNIYRCPFSASLNALKFGLGQSGDSINIFPNEKLTKKNLLDYIHKSNFVPSCKYCQGRSKILSRVEAARQVKKVREPFKKPVL